MSLVNLALSQLITFVFLGFAVMVVIKVSQLATDLSEIKDILAEIKRKTPDASSPSPAGSLAQPSDLIRAVNLASLDDSEEQKSLLDNPR